MISMDKKYRTRDGRDVRLLCVDGPDPKYPVVAVVGEDIYCWKPCGTYYASGTASVLDLIEYHEPDIRTIWVNVYEYDGSYDLYAHASAPKAVDACDPNDKLAVAIAQPVTFEVKRND